ncbi:putative ankyrin repeat protein RF_0381 [Leptopilina heterotoma]|uniref:putative ankyrin repeat protein RF_0381 n=1 Tax=Leptopilina heterotoma TaxID=63436 RepID=UPI001CAA0335|nr:putative ankyrin repeat protein RF_0381 [Leptopilina heterotoma]XP_043466721.1 putative ankyrin repeat protein RF_0381 [Leptopilina heterotoma]
MTSHKRDFDKTSAGKLYLAVGREDIHLITEILEKEVDVDINAMTHFGETSLYLAAKKGNVEMCQMLVNKGADVNIVKDNSGTPLHIAARKGRKEVVEFLLENGAKTNAIDTFRHTPLHFAAMGGSSDIVKIILKFNDKIKSRHVVDVYINAVTNDGLTALYFAAKKGNVEMCQILVNKGADVNMGHRRFGTPLHIAARKGREEIVKLLLENGGKINALDIETHRPLHSAAIGGSSDIVKIILKFGSKINSRDENGRTALFYASDYGNVEVVKILLEFGSDINIPNYDKRTPLNDAMKCLEFYNEHINDSDLLSGCESDSDSSEYISLGPETRIRRYLSVIEILKLHVIKLKAANLFVSKRNSFLVNRNSEEKDFQDECEIEVASMKCEKISDSNISFYDVLEKNTNSLANFMRNGNLVQVFESEDYKSQFPIYSSMIERNFKRGMLKKDLIEKRNKVFSLLCGKFSQLPEYCKEQIFSYLSDKELKIFVKAYQVLDISNV